MKRYAPAFASVLILAPILAAAATASPSVYNFETGSYQSLGSGRKSTPSLTPGLSFEFPDNLDLSIDGLRSLPRPNTPSTGSPSETVSPSGDVTTTPSRVPAGIVEQVSVTMSPSIPKPNEGVSVRVDSYSTNLNGAYIVWKINDQKVLEGLGEVTLLFTAPPAGESLTIVMEASKADGGTVEKKITVAPADLDLTYEAETYAHPFFQGRPTFTNSSRIRVAAVPKFIDPLTKREIPANNLIYTWRIDGTVDQKISGYGKSYADIVGKLISRGLDIEVEVEAIESPLKAHARLFIEDSQPDIAVYEDHPLYGVIFERAVDAERSYPVAENEISLLAVPYSMDIDNINDPRATFSWLTEQGKGPAAPVVTFRPEPGATGLAGASIKINHQNFAQYTSQSVTLKFGDTGAVPSVASTTPSGNYAL